MKKILLLLLLIVPFVANAQSYILTKKIVMDKFNDILLDRDQKSIITKTDQHLSSKRKGENLLRIGF